MLYSIAQEVAIGAACVKAMVYLIVIGVGIFIGVTVLKNLKPFS